MGTHPDFLLEDGGGHFGAALAASLLLALGVLLPLACVWVCGGRKSGWACGGALRRLATICPSLAQRGGGGSGVGRIQLVGAGPGDPDLLTVAALRAIQGADLVIADRLVSQGVLELVRCELRIAPPKRKRATDATFERANRAQDELHAWCLAALRQGRRVVRLKGGDPFVFGRGAEEVHYLRGHGYEPEVVPGLSSSLVAPLAGGMALTTRGVADQVLIATGHGACGAGKEAPEYVPQRTTVFLMAVSKLEPLTAALLKRGYPAELPAMLVETATTTTQRTVRGTVGGIAAAARAEGVRSPATFVVGRGCCPTLQMPVYRPSSQEARLVHAEQLPNPWEVTVVASPRAAK